MSTEQKTLGQIAWEIETEGYGWTWAEVHDQDRAHWERIANAVAAAVFERQKSAPQPTADERVEAHMQLVEIAANVYHSEWPQCPKLDAVEQSARALLSASQEDAEHAAMYRWLRSKSWASEAYDYGCTDYRFPVLTRTNYDGSINHATVDAAIRAAMIAKETK